MIFFIKLSTVQVSSGYIVIIYYFFWENRALRIMKERKAEEKKRSRRKDNHKGLLICKYIYVWSRFLYKYANSNSEPKRALAFLRSFLSLLVYGCIYRNYCILLLCFESLAMIRVKWRNKLYFCKTLLEGQQARRPRVRLAPEDL